MDKYYYLLSEIPHLIFGQESNITQRLFLAEAEKWLSEKDFIELIQLNINEFEEEQFNNSLLALYRSFEYPFHLRRKASLGCEIKIDRMPRIFNFQSSVSIVFIW